MVHFSTLLLVFSVAGSVTAAPSRFSKRIAQVISDSTPKWEAACVSRINTVSACEHVVMAVIRVRQEVPSNAMP